MYREADLVLTDELGAVNAMRDGWPALWVVFTDHLLNQFCLGELRFDRGDAYAKATGEANPKAASLLWHTPAIVEFMRAAIPALRNQDFGPHVVTFDETLRTLATIIRNDDVSISSRLDAMKLNAAIQGFAAGQANGPALPEPPKQDATSSHEQLLKLLEAPLFRERFLRLPGVKEALGVPE